MMSSFARRTGSLRPLGLECVCQSTAVIRRRWLTILLHQTDILYLQREAHRNISKPMQEEIRPMKRKTIYLIFCILGILLPYSQLVPWVVTQHGVPLGLFVRELFSTRIGGFFGMDVLVSAVVLIFFLRREGKRLGVLHLWLPIVGTLAVGVSLGFPLFLYLREGALERAGHTEAV